MPGWQPSGVLARLRGSSPALHHQQKEPVMPQADQATIDLLIDYFDAMEGKDFDRLGS